MKILFLVLSLLLAAQASAECGSDSECKGARICVEGACVDPPEEEFRSVATPMRLDAAPAQLSPARHEVAPAAPTVLLPPRRGVVAFHPVSMVTAGVLGGAMGATIIALPVGVEYALHPNFTLGGTATPMFVGANGSSAMGFGLDVNARIYPGGTGPDGGWLGGGVSAGSVAGVGAFNVSVGGGWQWVFRNGFAIGLGGELRLLSLAAGVFPLGVMVPIGFAF